MRLLPAIARLVGIRPRRAKPLGATDFGDMGTAFGLDAITTIDETPLDVAEPAPLQSALQRRLEGRSRL
ncbi:hypothetical protein [Piscinibacter koreensis]|uniref:Uncharacterized protein n=1 Tax=Piscinibacter koreensis TaxID=2742824 RepID=A0A7Y6NJF4_9BURK|nr:hypothetical protein [Schlegelella koreensis]NUZ04303.1 hypothetical protein [Schlegelella koreensis]